jgi:hypothetical protein
MALGRLDYQTAGATEYTEEQPGNLTEKQQRLWLTLRGVSTMPTS